MSPDRHHSPARQPSTLRACKGSSTPAPGRRHQWVGATRQRGKSPASEARAHTRSDRTPATSDASPTSEAKLTSPRMLVVVMTPSEPPRPGRTPWRPRCTGACAAARLSILILICMSISTAFLAASLSALGAFVPVVIAIFCSQEGKHPDAGLSESLPVPFHPRGPDSPKISQEPVLNKRRLRWHSVMEVR